VAFSITQLIEERQDDQYALHKNYINPSMTRVLGIIGFNKKYVRGKGAYLWDIEGNRYLDLLAEVSDRPRVRFHIPHTVALVWAYVDVALTRLIPNHIPTVTPETACLSRNYEYFDSGKAVRELGLPQTPAREALRKAVEWYRANGYAP